MRPNETLLTCQPDVNFKKNRFITNLYIPSHLRKWIEDDDNDDDDDDDDDDENDWARVKNLENTLIST